MNHMVFPALQGPAILKERVEAEQGNRAAGRFEQPKLQRYDALVASPAHQRRGAQRTQCEKEKRQFQQNARSDVYLTGLIQKK